jgi:ribosomal protein S18 acetylase RimI-like enzyme
VSRGGAAFVIRRATTDDLPFISEMLVEAAYPLADPKPLVEQVLAYPPTAAYLDGWGRRGDRALVACTSDDGERTGAAWYRLFSSSAPGFGFVDESTPELTLAVVPSYRGRGIGSRLLETLADHAYRDGFRALSLSVDPGNCALRLYERHGFARVPSGDDHWTMLLDLRGRAAARRSGM